MENELRPPTHLILAHLILEGVRTHSEVYSTFQSGMPEKCFCENCLKTNNQGLYQLKVNLFCIPIDFFGILNVFGHILGQISLSLPAKISYFFQDCWVTAFKLVIFFFFFEKIKTWSPPKSNFWGLHVFCYFFIKKKYY